MSNINRIRLGDGVYFNDVRDSRFKTMKITANIIVPLRADTAAANALACRLTDDELTLLGATLTQLGDTLVTIAAQRSICNSQKRAGN